MEIGRTLKTVTESLLHKWFLNFWWLAKGPFSTDPWLLNAWRLRLWTLYSSLKSTAESECFILTRHDGLKDTANVWTFWIMCQDDLANTPTLSYLQTSWRTMWQHVTKHDGCMMVHDHLESWWNFWEICRFFGGVNGKVLRLHLEKASDEATRPAPL